MNHLFFTTNPRNKFPANRGSAADRIALRSIGVSRFFAIEHRNAQGSLVTAAVKAATYLTPELEPDDPADWLEAKIVPVKRLIQVTQTI